MMEWIVAALVAVVKQSVYALSEYFRSVAVTVPPVVSGGAVRGLHLAVT